MDDDNSLKNLKNILLRNISRIEKSSTGCFNIKELKRRYEINKNKMDVEGIIKELINDGMIMKSPKKDMYCLTHVGKRKEHTVEEKYYKENSPFNIVRNSRYKGR